MINTLNESKLHKTLKEIYRIQNPGSKAEEKIGNYIADLVAPRGDVIEIQTANVSSLLNKIKYFIKEGYRVTVVYPTIKTKYIETLQIETYEIKRRKSPQKKDIYSIFRQLTGLVSIIPNDKFRLEVLEITMTEERKTTAIPTQSINNKRRFKKNWIKVNKRLESIENKYTFQTLKDWKNLIPYKGGDCFTTKDMLFKLKAHGSGISEKDIRILLWFYQKLGLLEMSGKLERSNLYRLTDMKV